MKRAKAVFFLAMALSLTSVFPVFAQEKISFSRDGLYIDVVNLGKKK
jgi:hypothetical protein